MNLSLFLTLLLAQLAAPSLPASPPSLPGPSPPPPPAVDAFTEELTLRPVGDRLLEASWRFALEFRPTVAHLCARSWGGEDDDDEADEDVEGGVDASDGGPALCHFELFPRDVADLLHLSGRGVGTTATRARTML